MSKGDPETTPDTLIWSPLGRPVARQVSVPPPPVVEKVSLYVSPSVAAGRLVVATRNGSKAMSVSVVVLVWAYESVKVTSTR